MGVSTTIHTCLRRRVPPVGPCWESADMVPRHVAESEATWSLPRQRRAGFGRGAHIAVSTEAETCYQQMTAWLGKCVVSPM